MEFCAPTIPTALALLTPISIGLGTGQRQFSQIMASHALGVMSSSQQELGLNEDTVSEIAEYLDILDAVSLLQVSIAIRSLTLLLPMLQGLEEAILLPRTLVFHIAPPRIPTSVGLFAVDRHLCPCVSQPPQNWTSYCRVVRSLVWSVCGCSQMAYVLSVKA